MELMQAIKNRREITHFKDTPLSKEVLESILEAGYLAPTGNNLPSRELILVTEKDLLIQLEKTTPYMPWLKEATAAVVITGRPSVSKYWIQDASITSGFLWLRATDLDIGVGFGAVYHHEDADESFRRENWVRDQLVIPDDRRILAILGLGYTAEQPKKKELPAKQEIIHYEKFGN